jgi:hypothetical protein
MELENYPLILSQKLKNAMLKARPGGKYYYRFDLKNIKVNASKRGCSGFITNTENGSIVYVNTEPIYCGYMFRYARTTNDYTGDINMYAKNLDTLACKIASMLDKVHNGWSWN